MSINEKTFAFSTTGYAHTSPALSELSAQTKIFNIQLTLDQALKLNLGLEEAIRKINRYKENTESGKRASVNLAIHLGVSRIAVAEGKLPKAKKQS
jgi:hypothetical protein